MYPRLSTYQGTVGAANGVLLMFDFFGLSTHWFQLSASGLIDAGWGLVWHWGLGIGVIILCIAAAILSPVGKQAFALAAACTFCLLVAYGMGVKSESALCEAKVKELYLKAHPGINAKNIAKNWTVSPSWDPSKPPNYKPISPKASSCYMGFGC